MKLPLLCAALCASSLALAQNDPSGTTGDTGTVTFNYRGAPRTYVTVRAADGKIWLQQNLGASAVATAYDDTAGYGHLFQWGRWDDAHQLRNSTTALATTILPNNPLGINTGSALFFRGPNPNDWWGAGTGTDSWTSGTPTASRGTDPCTAIAPNWRLATEADWGAVLTAENITNRSSAFSSNLKLTAGGQREGAQGNLLNVDLYGNYWTSTASGPYAKNVTIGDNFINPSDDALRSYGFSLRCMTATCTGLFQPDAIQGDDTVCQGRTHTFSVPANPNASPTGYSWTVPTGWSIAAGAGTNIIIVIVGTAGGAVSVTASNACGTSAARTLNTVAVPTPVPVISLNGLVMSSSGTFTAYQWNRNGVPVSGATASSYQPVQDGNYTLTVTNASGCQGTSNVVVINALSVRNGAAASIRVYPNPATDRIRIEAGQPVNAAIYGMDGRLLLAQQNATGLNVAQLQPGIYSLRITSADGALLKTERLVK